MTDAALQPAKVDQFEDRVGHRGVVPAFPCELERAQRGLFGLPVEPSLLGGP
jgi:hypothetical protein